MYLLRTTKDQKKQPRSRGRILTPHFTALIRIMQECIIRLSEKIHFMSILISKTEVINSMNIISALTLKVYVPCKEVDRATHFMFSRVLYQK